MIAIGHPALPHGLWVQDDTPPARVVRDFFAGTVARAMELRKTAGVTGGRRLGGVGVLE